MACCGHTESTHIPSALQFPKLLQYDPVRLLVEVIDGSADAEQDEPEPEEYDPGPEIDDEGGMSEYRHALPGDPF
jgi:hypothetical protein